MHAGSRAAPRSRATPRAPPPRTSPPPPFAQRRRLFSSPSPPSRNQQYHEVMMARAAGCRQWPMLRANGGLGLAAISYVLVDYSRHISPSWHERLQPALWAVLILAVILRAPFYRHWNLEIRAAVPFIASLVFLLGALLAEVLCVRFVTAVLGLNWHSSTSPLPDTGQWLLLALNEKLPQFVVDILRARIIALEHYLLLSMVLAFFCSVQLRQGSWSWAWCEVYVYHGCRPASPGHNICFYNPSIPPPRPWCALYRFQVPPHPHPWSQKFYEPYASDFDAIRKLIRTDTHYADVKEYPVIDKSCWRLWEKWVPLVMLELGRAVKLCVEGGYCCAIVVAAGMMGGNVALMLLFGLGYAWIFVHRRGKLWTGVRDGTPLGDVL